MLDDGTHAGSHEGSALDELATVADHASLGLIRFDSRLRVRSANLAAHRALERRPGSLIGRTIIEAFVDHRLERLVRAATAGSSASGSVQSTEGISLVVRASPSSDGGAWATIENTTELERLRRIRTEFIENLSHELRTPLANVRLLTELLKDDLDSIDVPARIRERIATMDVETGHMVQMINEMLELSRMEQATTTLRQDQVALRPLVADTARRLLPFAERQGVAIRVLVSADLPPVRGEAERLGQLLMNLLHNAVKFSPSGGAVRVTAEEHPDAAVIAIADEGMGIPAADQDRIFERFYKVDRARQRGQGGTGLGLAIARHIVEAHGGRIWLESAEGRGSTFRFSVPFA